MHPIVFLFLLALLCFVGPYALSAILLAGGATAVVIGVVEYGTAVFAGFTPYGAIKHLKITPPEESDSGPDPAYRSYYAGPVLLDYQQVLGHTFTRVWARVVAGKPDEYGNVSRSQVDRVWRWSKTTATPKMLAWPAAAAATVGLVLGVCTAIAFVTVTSLIFLAFLIVLVVGALITAGVSRVLELGLLFLRGITIECPTCHDKVTRPIYRCPECGAAHRKLVPGRTGVLHRTCRCQERLPTLLALGKANLRAQCAQGHPLPLKGLQAPTAHIPVIAGPQAGKSVFMHSAVSRLMQRGGGFEFADERAKDEFETNVQLKVHLDPSSARKTVIARPRAYNVYVGAQGSRSRRLLYLYDAAGELLVNVDGLADSQFLAHTKGVVFIVDPFSMRQVRSGTDRSTLGRVKASNEAPGEVLGRFVEALRERGVRKRGNRIDLPVAVVLTKTDGLRGPTDAGHPYRAMGSRSREARDTAVRTWLEEVGQGDLTSSLDNNFTTVSYFAVSYEDAVTVAEHESVVNDDPAVPLLWLLDRKAV
ncbi:hypothetical protein GCM10022243_61880 [Saccharothrix violaceirubra]|uniref:Double-GTPase 2 domain-containing protein n=1 Tax=Saccharothrix violaceirubra TaxID=413306 RepID=A0A7W7WY53_9PSEU|nr:hypothetical protein [Saccharothrix violaceirubra]MBB4968164.1 hypothetical protein [Saccharothrix violaceirubra]